MDKMKNEYRVKVDMNGNIIIPEEMKKKMGAIEGAELRVVVEKDRIEILPNIHSLSKVYIEPTSLCNLRCETCVRNTWTEPMGAMDIGIFNKLVEQLKDFKHLQSVMFGGIGEPTFHKDILYMIGSIKSLGIKAEMITNGILLNEKMIKGLFENKLDTLWISFDGTDEKMFDEIRTGASFAKVVENLTMLKAHNAINKHKIKIGIAFVAMKDNIHELSNIDKLARAIGASMVSVSNLIPYEKDMVDQMLCKRTIAFNVTNPLSISLPLLDMNEDTKEPLYELYKKNNNISIMNNKVGTETSKCKFIKERCTFIRWDGMVCPCMGLLHSNTTYPYNVGTNRQRKVDAYTLGSIDTTNLQSIWESDEYSKFRNDVDYFEFSPCLSCGPCANAESNVEDCISDASRTCGGCMWGQGVVQCP